jgi:hypothetical protein
MATTFYLQEAGVADSSDKDPPGNLSSDTDLLLGLNVRGSGISSSSTNTVTGPTSGVQCTWNVNGNPLSWWSKTLTGVTISGTITFNVWGSENSMSANSGLQVILDRCDGSGSFISQIVNSEKGTELPTSNAAQNWTASPTSTTLATGDRIRCRVYGNDAGGTMATGFRTIISFGSTSGGVDGDSFITFTETITEGTAATSLLIPHRHRGLIVR